MNSAACALDGLLVPQAPAAVDTAAAVAGGDFGAALAAVGVAGADSSEPVVAPPDAALQMLIGLFEPEASPEPPRAEEDAVQELMDELAASGAIILESPAALVLANPSQVAGQPLEPTSAPAEQAALLMSQVTTTATGTRPETRSGSRPIALQAAPQADSLATGIELPKTASDPITSESPVATDAVKPDGGSGVLGALLERISTQVGRAEPQADGHHVGPALYSDTGALQATPVRAQQADTVKSAVGSPRWSSEVGSKVVLMAINRQQEGSLSLTPEHLGPVEVRINVTPDATNVWFTAQHAETRAALADALPRLREMFTASGLALGNAGVSHEMPRQEARPDERPGFTAIRGEGPEEAAPVPQVRRLRLALLDAWA